jgi:GT2 family glycosyltransferase
MKLYAVVVTYNRLNSLKLCLNALKSQTNNVNILVVNNGSTDGTFEYLKEVEGIEYFTQSNLGGAGGFSAGIGAAVERGADWIWCMDDDLIPYKNTLEELVKASDLVPDAAFLNSLVYDRNGQVEAMPPVDFRPGLNGWPACCENLEYGIVRIESGPFLSILIRGSFVTKIGLPLKEFFIWGDDTEYTRRLSKLGKGYLIGSSKAVHDRIPQRPSGIIEYNSQPRLGWAGLLIRNYLYTIRKHGTKRELAHFCVRQLWIALKIMAVGPLRFKKSYLVISSLIQGAVFSPVVVFPKK